MTGFLYLMQRASGGAIKVGYAVDPDRRRRSLEQDEPLVILDLVRTRQRREEALVHGWLAPHRVRGEWYADCPEVRAVLGRLRDSRDIPTLPSAPVAADYASAVLGFARRLIDVRHARILTQAEVAERIGCSVRSYQSYEAGRVFPHPRTRRRIDEWLAEEQAA